MTEMCKKRQPVLDTIPDQRRGRNDTCAASTTEPEWIRTRRAVDHLNSLQPQRMLGAGIEPAWCFPQGILSPLRLPVSPPERTVDKNYKISTPRRQVRAVLLPQSFAPRACTAYHAM